MIEKKQEDNEIYEDQNTVEDVARQYNDMLHQEGLQFYFESDEMKETLKEILSDYRRVAKRAKKEGVDIGEDNEDDYAEILDSGSEEEKEAFASRLQEQIKITKDVIKTNAYCGIIVASEANLIISNQLAIMESLVEINKKLSEMKGISGIG